MLYQSPANPSPKTLFGAHNKFKRGCEEAAVTRLSYISSSDNNNGKEVGLLAEVDTTTWQVGEEASQWGCDQSGRRQTGGPHGRMDG
jgi:hypothetical protein